MKRTLLALALTAVATTSFARLDQYRNDAGESEQGNVVKQQLGAVGGSFSLASFDTYRPNAGESTDNNVVQHQLG